MTEKTVIKIFVAFEGCARVKWLNDMSQTTDFLIQWHHRQLELSFETF